MATLKCPKCRGTHIQLWRDDVNTVTKHRTSVNLNPLRPFTVFNTKEFKKGKLSPGKLALGAMTGGASLLVTGARSDKHNEYYCMDCGNRWVGK